MRVIGKVVGVQDTAMGELTKGVHIKRKHNHREYLDSGNWDDDKPAKLEHL